MKTLDILNCSRPVIFETNFEGFEYSIGGTGFIVKFYDRIYVVTAKHILKHHSWNQLRIQYCPDERDFLTITELYSEVVVDEEDSDQFDLVVFIVEHDVCNEKHFKNHKPYNLLEIDKYTIFSPTSKFLFRGFPIELRPIDWEKKKIFQSAFLGHAKYLYPTDLTGIHKIEFIRADCLKSPDGLSGSPVFQINQDDQGFAREAFAGMLIKSTKESNCAYFLEHKRIIAVISKIRDELTCNP